MRAIELASTKYDGSLHYRYRVGLVSMSPDLVMVYCRPGTPVVSYRGQLVAGRHTLALLWRDRPYNLHVNWQADWRPHSHYVNVATPASWDEHAVRFVDLDLDVIWKVDGTLILDDEDEFELHRERFGYPPELVSESWRCRDEVADMIVRGVYPFDGSLYRWRPYGAP